LSQKDFDSKSEHADFVILVVLDAMSNELPYACDQVRNVVSADCKLAGGKSEYFFLFISKYLCGAGNGIDE